MALGYLIFDRHMPVVGQIIENTYRFFEALGNDIGLILEYNKIPFSKFMIFFLLILLYLFIKILSKVITSIDSKMSRLSQEDAVGGAVQGLSASSRYLSREANLNRAIASHEEFSRIKEGLLKEHSRHSFQNKLSFKRAFFNILRLLTVVIIMAAFFIFPWTLGEALPAGSKMAYSFLCLLVSVFILWWGGDIGKY